jgi:hypothetical protein
MWSRMGNFPKISGKIEKVWDNATSSGKPYKVVELENGDRYSLWRAGDFEKVYKGEMIEFDFSTSGKGYRNIERIYNGSEAPEVSPGEKPGTDNPVNGQYEGPGNGNGANGNGYGGDRLGKMVKMSCLKSASNLFSGTKIPFEQRADRVIEMAKKFEKYIDDDAFEPDSLEHMEPKMK